MLRFCVGFLILGFFAAPAILAGEAETAALVARLGGSLERRDAQADGPIVRVDLHECAVTDSDLAALTGLSELRHLDLRKTTIGDAGVAHLRGLNLHTLNLFRTKTSDVSLPILAQMTQLETLLLGGTQVSDAGLVALRPLQRLRKLSLFDTHISDAGLVHLQDLGSLAILLVGKSKVTDQGRADLQRFRPNLVYTEPT